MPTRVCLWTPVEKEELTNIMEPTNIQDKFAVAVKKKKKLVGHLSKGKTGQFAKTIFYFLKSCESNRQSNKSRRWNGDESSMQTVVFS